MEWIFRAIIICLAAALFAAAMDRAEPAFSLLLGVSAAAAVLLLSGNLLEPLLQFLDKLKTACGVSGVYTQPLIRCMAVSLMTRMGAALCKDAKQNGSAAALEFLGTAAAIWTCLPLLEAFLSMLQEVL